MKRSLVILCGALALNLQATNMDDMINKGVKIATHASSGDYKSMGDWLYRQAKISVNEEALQR